MLYYLFSNSLVIHAEQTKEITTVKKVWICDLNWKAQSKNDPLIFRPFLKVFRSSCQLLLNTFKNGRKIKGSFLLWALQLSMNFCFDFLQELLMVWEAISNIWKVVSSDIQTPWSWLKKTRLHLIFSTTSQCLDIRWNTFPHVWYITSSKLKYKVHILQNMIHWFEHYFSV